MECERQCQMSYEKQLDRNQEGLFYDCNRL